MVSATQWTLCTVVPKISNMFAVEPDICNNWMKVYVPEIWHGITHGLATKENICYRQLNLCHDDNFKILDVDEYENRLR